MLYPSYITVLVLAFGMITRSTKMTHPAKLPLINHRSRRSLPCRGSNAAPSQGHLLSLRKNEDTPRWWLKLSFLLVEQAIVDARARNGGSGVFTGQLKWHCAYQFLAERASCGSDSMFIWAFQSRHMNRCYCGRVQSCQHMHLQKNLIWIFRFGGWVLTTAEDRLHAPIVIWWIG